MSVIVELGKKRAWIHSKLKIVSFHEIDGWNLFPVMFFYMITSNNRKQDEYSDGGNRPNRRLVPTNPGKCSNGSGIGTVNYFL